MQWMLNVYFYLFVQCFVFTECYAWTRYLWDVCEWHNDAKAVLNKRAREYVVSVSARVYECMGDCVYLIAAHDAADPVVVLAHTGVDAGVSRHGTLITPGHDSLQLTVTHQRTTGVSLQTQAEGLCYVCHGTFLSSRWAITLKLKCQIVAPFHKCLR